MTEQLLEDVKKRREQRRQLGLDGACKAGPFAEIVGAPEELRAYFLPGELVQFWGRGNEPKFGQPHPPLRIAEVMRPTGADNLTHWEGNVENLRSKYTYDLFPLTLDEEKVGRRFNRDNKDDVAREEKNVPFADVVPLYDKECNELLGKRYAKFVREQTCYVAESGQSYRLMHADQVYDMVGLPPYTWTETKLPQGRGTRREAPRFASLKSRALWTVVPNSVKSLSKLVPAPWGRDAWGDPYSVPKIVRVQLNAIDRSADGKVVTFHYDNEIAGGFQAQPYTMGMLGGNELPDHDACSGVGGSVVGSGYVSPNRYGYSSAKWVFE